MLEALCLALNVYFEARGEPIDGQIAVLDVTRNRIESPRWPNTACEVVTQPHQFSWTANPQKSSEDPLWPVLQLVWSQPTLGITADHYHTVDIEPYWASKLQYEGKVGNHVFYASF